MTSPSPPMNTTSRVTISRFAVKPPMSSAAAAMHTPRTSNLHVRKYRRSNQPANPPSALPPTKHPRMPKEKDRNHSTLAQA